MNDEYIYRDATEDDLDSLYQSTDAKWLIENFETRDSCISTTRGGKPKVMTNMSEYEKLFYFAEDFNKHEKGDWYVYYENNNGIFVFQDRGSFHSIFYSQNFLDNRKEIELKVLDLLLLASKENKLGLYPTHEINEELKERFEFDFQLGDTGRF